MTHQARGETQAAARRHERQQRVVRGSITAGKVQEEGVPALKEFGLAFRPDFLTDQWFYAALLAAPVTLAVMDFLLPAESGNGGISIRLVLLMVLWQPLVEELLFRGMIQGRLGSKPWARRRFFGISVANLLSSMVFVLAHLVHHAPAWAGAVVVPSLIFGYFRERHDHIYSALILHAAYNACYLLAVP